MREHARNYVIYLRRRVEDFADADRPVPKWSDLDHEAVKVVLDEFERLQHANQSAGDTLRKHGLAPSRPKISTGDRDLPFDSDTGSRLLLLACGVLLGAFLREIIAVF
ncbi:MAG TPA: hypothetical protein VFV93_01280 [Thermomicrobiales bacterium]|nr:hypothetical protein [Thermomicrobiales bacterium]